MPAKVVWYTLHAKETHIFTRFIAERLNSVTWVGGGPAGAYDLTQFAHPLTSQEAELNRKRREQHRMPFSHAVGASLAPWLSASSAHRRRSVKLLVLLNTVRFSTDSTITQLP